MKIKFILLLGIFISQTFRLAADTLEIVQGKTYTTTADLLANEYFNGVCSSSAQVVICQGGVFEVKNITPNEVIIKLNRAYNCSVVNENNQAYNIALVGKTYCIDKNKFTSSNMSTSRTKLNFGPLLVPMKFQIKDFRIYPAGEIGFYLGPRFLSKKDPKKYWSIIGSIGFTQIALNDLNSSSPEKTRSVSAFSGAAGVVYNFGQNFQFGAISGVDLFNVDGNKINRSWISITLGIILIRDMNESDSNQTRTLH